MIITTPKITIPADIIDFMVLALMHSKVVLAVDDSSDPLTLT